MDLGLMKFVTHLVTAFSLIFPFCAFSGDCEDEYSMVIDLEKGINLALSAERKLGNAIGNLRISEDQELLAESELSWQIIPKGDVGYVGGGTAGAGFTVGTGIELSKKFLPGTKIMVNPSFMKAANHYETHLRSSITQPLLRGFGSDFTLAGLHAAQYSRRTATRALYTTKARLVLETIEGMYEIVKQKALVELDRESLKRIEKFYNTTKRKADMGLSDSFDLFRTETEKKQAQDSLSNSLESLQTAEDHLRDVLALSPEQLFEVKLPLEYQPTELDEQEATNTALKNRIELEQVKDELQESQRLEKLACKGMKPELNLVVDYSNFANDEIFTRAWSWSAKRESRWGIGFTTSTNPFSRKEELAYAQSQLATDESSRRLLQVEDNITLDVKQSIRKLRRYNEKIELQKGQIKNAEKAVLLAQLKFEHGQANNFDLIQSEKNLRQALRSAMIAIIDYKMGEYQLMASMGMLMER